MEWQELLFQEEAGWQGRSQKPWLSQGGEPGAGLVPWDSEGPGGHCEEPGESHSSGLGGSGRMAGSQLCGLRGSPGSLAGFPSPAARQAELEGLKGLGRSLSSWKPLGPRERCGQCDCQPVEDAQLCQAAHPLKAGEVPSRAGRALPDRVSCKRGWASLKLQGHRGNVAQVSAQTLEKAPRFTAGWNRLHEKVRHMEQTGRAAWTRVGVCGRGP